MNRTCLYGILIILVLSAIPAVAGSAPAAIPLADGSAGTTSNLVNASGGWGNVAYQEPEPLVTLLQLESNQSTFPGPRSMAFGPRRIEFSGTVRGLLIIATVACMAVLAFALYRRTTKGRKRDEL